MFHPGYTPPNQITVGELLLDMLYDKQLIKIKNLLCNKNVCMALNGWSNIHKESVVCLTVTIMIDETVNLIHTIDTQDKHHNHSYI